ncbi:MAG: hypothetical protein M1816_007948 [Peltula sp. TS41687]|nr:MAG: hypothetical protein M1816_007948 [Peltula sp. TS41687]
MIAKNLARLYDPEDTIPYAYFYSLPALKFESLALDFTNFDVTSPSVGYRSAGYASNGGAPLPRYVSYFIMSLWSVDDIDRETEEPAHVPHVLDPIDEDPEEVDDGASYCPSPAPPPTDDGEDEEEVGQDVTGFEASCLEDQGEPRLPHRWQPGKALTPNPLTIEEQWYSGESILVDESVLVVEYAGTLLRSLISEMSTSTLDEATPTTEDRYVQCRKTYGFDWAVAEAPLDKDNVVV